MLFVFIARKIDKMCYSFLEDGLFYEPVQNRKYLPIFANLETVLQFFQLQCSRLFRFQHDSVY